ncbi:MAG: ABC transporter transmembrane domain-containing protein, partial [Acidimicrobiia bacterium]|nr:ABC transporter transmembrane domain-containing protein [Acidimicrobiia bacterium]
MGTTGRWRQLRSRFPRSRRALILEILLSIVTTLLLIPVPLVARYAVDDAISVSSPGRIIGAGAVLIALLIAGELVGLLRRFLMAHEGKIAIARLRRDMIAKLHDLPISYHRRNPIDRAYEQIIGATTAVDAMVQAVLTSVIP